MPRERVYTTPNPDDSFVTFDIGWNSEHGSVSLTASRYVYIGEDVPPENPLESIVGNDLTYKQLNKLIKALRKARDAAYGKPE